MLVSYMPHLFKIWTSISDHSYFALLPDGCFKAIVMATIHLLILFLLFDCHIRPQWVFVSEVIWSNLSARERYTGTNLSQHGLVPATLANLCSAVSEFDVLEFLLRLRAADTTSHATKRTIFICLTIHMLWEELILYIVRLRTQPAEHYPII